MSVIVPWMDIPESCRVCQLRFCCKNQLPLVTMRADKCRLQEVNPQIDADIYDKETTIYGCTVQILENTVTGKTSVGWWREDET